MGIRGRLDRLERQRNEVDTRGCRCTFDVVSVGRDEPQRPDRPTNPNRFCVPDEASVPPRRRCPDCGRPRLQVLFVEADPGVPFAPHRNPSAAG